MIGVALIFRFWISRRGVTLLVHRAPPVYELNLDSRGLLVLVIFLH